MEKHENYEGSSRISEFDRNLGNVDTHDKVKVFAPKKKFAEAKMKLSKSFRALKGKVNKNKKAIISGGLALTAIAGIAVSSNSCSKDKSKNTNTTTTAVYDYDAFYDNAIKLTMQKFEAAGYPISEVQAKDLVYGINAEEAIDSKHINSNTNDTELFDNCLAYTGKIISQYVNAIENYLYSDECGKGTVKDISVADLVAADNDYDKAVIKKLESYQKKLEKMVLREKGVYSAIILDEDKAKFDKIMLEIRDFWTCSGGIKIKDGDKTVNVTLHDIGEGDKLMAAATVIYKITYLIKNINESIVYYKDDSGKKVAVQNPDKVEQALAYKLVALQTPEIVKTLENAPASLDSAELENKLAAAVQRNIVPCPEAKNQKVKTK